MTPELSRRIQEFKEKREKAALGIGGLAGATVEQYRIYAELANEAVPIMEALEQELAKQVIERSQFKEWSDAQMEALLEASSARHCDSVQRHAIRAHDAETRLAAAEALLRQVQDAGLLCMAEEIAAYFADKE